ncbi:MAG: ADP-ribosylglycohydrolase family protein [Saprospiraceae bacterium]|nr:ADP-ribosylglycohydrolase family protein [Saprospiraceae bacterium]
MTFNPVSNALLGVAVGDALGVPFEFKTREELEHSPAKDMVGYGTYGQPAGTWSDDTSLTLCLADSLLQGYDLKAISKQFFAWRYGMEWTARGDVFDIGMTTAAAIKRIRDIVEYGKIAELKLLKYQAEEYDNGNGSLMRILPLLFYIKGMDIGLQFELTWEVSALTHRYIRAAMSCLIYLKLAENLLNGMDKYTAYKTMQKQVMGFWTSLDFAEHERTHFKRVIESDIHLIKQKDIKSGGYVIESLEASLWCFLNNDNYEKTVLAAVNLGHDTDTTAAIAGGLAGLYYGAENIPQWWLASIARLEDIVLLSENLNQKYNQ